MICQRCGIETTGNSICDDCKKILFKSESVRICEAIDTLSVTICLILRDVVEELKKMNELTEGK